MEENMVIAPNEEIGVEELEENLTGEAEQQQAEENDEWIAGIRQGLGELFEDGWTTGELGAMTQDEAVQREIADGHGVVARGVRLSRSGCWRRRRRKKGMVPIARTTAAGTVRPGSRNRADERQGVCGFFKEGAGSDDGGEGERCAWNERRDGRVTR